MEKVAMRPEDFEFNEREMALRSTSSLKKGNFIDFCDKLDGFDEVITPEESTCAKRRKVKIVELQTTSFSFKYLVSENCRLPKPRIWFSPKSIGELDMAAIKLQKVYKGYRTRRNLADCAIVCEELWRKGIDLAALSRRGSISHLDKSETAASKWARAGTMAAKVGKGLSKDDKGQKLALRHWLEAIDSRHRYGHNLHFYYVVWFHSQSFQPFFYWLDIGDGKELNLDKCPRIELQRQCITYLGPKEREAYEVTVDSGMLVYRQNRALVHTPQGSKWIFVLSTSRTLYIGEKKKGLFQHSSFLAGGATIASGRLVAYNGVLDAIWPYSGHYCPTEKNLMEFVSFLEEHNVDLTNVKKYAIDDDVPPSEPVDEELELQCEGIEGNLGASEKSVAHFGTNVEAASQVKESKPLSTKWTTGAGPRIACVREYPTKLQVHALEQLNLSPRTIPGKYACKAPIPSPRPSPKFHFSPRLVHMGLPSPRIHISRAY